MAINNHSIAAVLAQAKQQIDAIDAEALLSFILNKNRSYFRAWPERKIEPTQWQQFQRLLERRQQGEPLAYIIGSREFWSLNLRVTPATLIPRPDTEILVEEALRLIPEDADWHIADLGTGSGAIALAIANERPNCTLVASDISTEALAVAKQNAIELRINNVEFRLGNWGEVLKAGELFQLIAANPPYVNRDDKHLEEDGLPFEPINALTPGLDGLSSIRIIADQVKKHLINPAWLLLEHGYDQGGAVRTLLQKQNYDNANTLRDFGNNERMTRAQKIMK